MVMVHPILELAVICRCYICLGVVIPRVCSNDIDIEHDSFLVILSCEHRLIYEIERAESDDDNDGPSARRGQRECGTNLGRPIAKKVSLPPASMQFFA
jgi:hypothetical protein